MTGTPIIQYPNAALSEAKLGAPALAHGSKYVPMISMAGSTARVAASIAAASKGASDSIRSRPISIAICGS